MHLTWMHIPISVLWPTSCMHTRDDKAETQENDSRYNCQLQLFNLFVNTTVYLNRRTVSA